MAREAACLSTRVCISVSRVHAKGNVAVTRKSVGAASLAAAAAVPLPSLPPRISRGPQQDADTVRLHCFKATPARLCLNSS